LVSIITATYNRGNVLRYAIESVRRQTLADWEMWVVGDACTDGTGDVVRGFGDPRIHFLNLAQNVGDQSGPNNEGFQRSAGRFIAGRLAWRSEYFKRTRFVDQFGRSRLLL
jgi:glycosyltransferase involved in cell wall biosynthesis